MIFANCETAARQRVNVVSDGMIAIRLLFGLCSAGDCSSSLGPSRSGPWSLPIGRYSSIRLLATIGQYKKISNNSVLIVNFAIYGNVRIVCSIMWISSGSYIYVQMGVNNHWSRLISHEGRPAFLLCFLESSCWNLSLGDWRPIRLSSRPCYISIFCCFSEHFFFF